MIALPAIDLKGGQVVQLVGGRPEAERVRWPEPMAVARGWVEAGFQALHVVDLDAALGTRGEDGRARTNLGTVRAIVEAVEVPVQVGGGVRDDAVADGLLEAGAARVVVGTRAVEDAAWLSALADRHPNRVVVAADVRDGSVLTRGWTEGTGLAVEGFLERLAPLPLAGVLVTDVGREGRLTGVDDALFGSIVRASRHPLFAAGGIAGIDDLRRLDRAGVSGAVLGMSLYTGAIDARAAAKEFSE